MQSLQIIVHSHLFSSLPKKKKPPLFSSSSTTSSCIVYAINKDTSSSSSSQQQQQQKQYDYIIDKDKARQALQNLDQQLETLSQKQVPPPKIRASEVKLGGLDNMGDEMPDYSGSFLPYMTATLLAFSIFYNILFYKVIKPSIDFPAEPVYTAAQTSSQPVSQNQSSQDATRS